MTTRNLLFLAGRTLEKILQESLVERLSVLPTAEYLGKDGHGPRMLDNGEGTTLPDFQVHGKEIRGWIDSKAKSKPNRFHKWERMEHGIDLCAWDAYIKIQAETRMPVYLFVFELSSGGVLAASLNTLQAAGVPRKGRWNRDTRSKECINFNYTAFVFVGNWTVPEDDLRLAKFNLDWDKIKKMMSQLGFKEAANA